MPSRVKCFLLLPTDQCVVTLERWAYTRADIGRERPRCGRAVMRYPGMFAPQIQDTHRTEVEIFRQAAPTEHGSGIDGANYNELDLDADPMWPMRCACGYEYQLDDDHAVRWTRLYRRDDTGELMTVEAAPAGAMYNARYCMNLDDYTKNGPDVSLVLKTPAGEWHIDGPSSNNKGIGWRRTGTPPEITASPSIAIGNPQKLHGWLRNGWLEIDFP